MMNPNHKFSLIILTICILLITTNTTAVIANTDEIAVNQSSSESAIVSGFNYIQTQMNDDGGIRWMDETSSVSATIQVVQALAATHFSQTYLMSESGNTPIDFLLENGEAWIWGDENDPMFSVSRAGKLLTALAAANEDPYQFGPGSTNLVHQINAYYDENTGFYLTSTPDYVLDQTWAVIGLAANNQAIPEETVLWLASSQLEDGSWNDGWGSYLDTTPLVILALMASEYYDHESLVIQTALKYLKNNQQADGGFQNTWDTVTNVNTTGGILQAIHAVGQSPDDDYWQQPEGNPITALLASQQESGAFGGEFANSVSTADGIIGLAGSAITDLGYLKAVSDGFGYLFESQEQSGGWGSVGQTLDIILAVETAGWDPNSITYAENSPLDYINANLEDYIISGPDAIGKAILGITALGNDPYDVSGINLVESLVETYQSSNNAFGDPNNTWHQSFGILGLHAAGHEIPDGAVTTLLSLQNSDGGWEYTKGSFGTSADNTSLAIQALVASGVSPQDPVVTRAIEFIESKQINDQDWGDSSTTAFALMAINSLRNSGFSDRSEPNKDPISILLSYQKENGAFFYNHEFPDNSLMSTASALTAVLGEDYIIHPEENTLPQAVIMIDDGEGLITTSCIPLDSDSMNGLDLLANSGIAYTISKDGFIESIIGVSNPEGGTMYWSYWSWDGRAWQFSQTGAGASTVLPGTITAWLFTSWESFPSPPPAVVPDFGSICSPRSLMSYQAHPYLNFYDLPENDLQQVEAYITDQETAIAVQTQIPTSDSSESELQLGEFEGTTDTPGLLLPSKQPSDEEQASTKPFSPLVIIAGMGAVAILLVLYILLRHRR